MEETPPDAPDEVTVTNGQPETSPEARMAELDNLKSMKDDGMITEEEFKEEERKLLDKMLDEI